TPFQINITPSQCESLRRPHASEKERVDEGIIERSLFAKVRNEGVSFFLREWIGLAALEPGPLQCGEGVLALYPGNVINGTCVAEHGAERGVNDIAGALQA